ncbi:peptidyl-prolyl cis-trans isomerase [Dorea formicigenerans]|uniref:Peptidyl-prolyl cis-trans isomerase n=1 Tax=Dorea formicigenerans TaxID=39486 RepID=A0A3E4F7K9_9FIRM|nr:peptidylprolyl isomerase [Dorea formicigenerans]RGI84936.1 peptidyl-prolyl cis-trans isomerase [Dorea formicigenerans]RGI88647.1 peptidyl-prolyl cis-trans isomerase [Dorea formicigenerans]
MKKRLFALALAGVLAAVTLTGCGSLKGDETVATVDDTKIDADLANFFARYTQATYETYYSAYLGEDMWNSDASDGETYEESVKSSVLKSLEDMILLEKHMEDYDVSITDEDKAMIKETTQQFLNDNSLDDKNLVSGNEKTVNRALTLMAVQQKMRTAIQAGADTEVSDEEAAQKSMDYVFISYQTKDDSGNSKDVSDDEKAQLKSQAEAIASGLKEGGDLNTLAEEQGATVQTLTFDKDTTSPEEDLIKAADALGEGESTDVIETEKGCYVAKVTSLLDRTATDSKKSQIVQERRTKLYDDTLKKWRKKADIKVHKDVWKKVSFQKVSVKMKTETQTPYADQVQTDDQAQTK